jgi:hypothetical protein
MSGEPENKPSETSTEPTSTSLVNTEAPKVDEPKLDAEGKPIVTEEVKTEEVKTEAPAFEALTPESFKLPEGFETDEETTKGFLDIMNDEKLTRAELAQKLVDYQAGLMTKMSEAGAKLFADQQEEWQNAARADPDIGGEKLAPALGQIAGLLDKYGSPELRTVFDVTGAGNNPLMIKFLSKIAADLSEGGPVLGAPPVSQASLAERMYPSMKKQGA